MTSRVVRALMLGCSALLPLCDLEAQAQETLALPQINVTAPSPIRRRPAPPPADAVPVMPSAPSAPSEASMQGTLPVVTDQFATVTVVPKEEIQRSPGSTLGDVLFSKPGITGSSFAPGASSRPIIRGLDVNRVGIVENGVGAGGVSDLGEDHFVPVDPLATSQIEVIRGPAALRYGSTSIGGVVSATNNRIPDALPTCAAAPFQTYGLPAKAPLANVEAPPCVAVETRTAVSSVDRGVEGGILLDAGGNNVAVHLDASGRKAGDYSIPSYPYLFDQSRPVNGKQPNSSA